MLAAAPVAWRRFTIVLLLGSAVVAGLVWRHHTAPYHFQTVTPKVLYRSGTLSKNALQAVIEEYSIKTVVNLRSPTERDDGWYEEEAAICRDKGVTLLNLPHNFGQCPTDEAIVRFLALFEHDANLPVLVHCKHGVVRTGMIVAAYDIEVLKKSNREALDDMPLFGHERYEVMERFVLGYKPQLRRE